MEDVAWVSIFGTLGMLLAMTIVVVKLMLLYMNGSEPAGPTEIVANTSWQVGLSPSKFHKVFRGLEALSSTGNAWQHSAKGWLLKMAIGFTDCMLVVIVMGGKWRSLDMGL
jgi:hypothetical protein